VRRRRSHDACMLRYLSFRSICHIET
jgi:hypothetical protein